MARPLREELFFAASITTYFGQNSISPRSQLTFNERSLLKIKKRGGGRKGDYIMKTAFSRTMVQQSSKPGMSLFKYLGCWSGSQAGGVHPGGEEVHNLRLRHPTKGKRLTEDKRLIFKQTFFFS